MGDVRHEIASHCLELPDRRQVEEREDGSAVYERPRRERKSRFSDDYFFWLGGRTLEGQLDGGAAVRLTGQEFEE
jgi:hypothetical protein